MFRRRDARPLAPADVRAVLDQCLLGILQEYATLRADPPKDGPGLHIAHHRACREMLAHAGVLMTFANRLAPPASGGTELSAAATLAAMIAQAKVAVDGIAAADTCA